LSRPIKEFTEALRRFGTDPRASPIPEKGPRELRSSIAAFNAMQAQIQTFVDDGTIMLAAISHDLRTPLTKIRLRGEFVEDEEQRARLFRDVDDMQAMIESALAFFRDDFQGEETTTFDFPDMLRTIADDYSDQGFEIAYDGAEHIAFRGRPFALKRAFANLVDNAVKYGRAPELEFRSSGQQFVAVVRDSGPGIPPEATEQVFAPFYRLERSRNRATGGVGLGLTSARAVIRAHGGDISLRNRPTGGLEVEISLPIAR
jgi:signal transduction histidine kinase